jgi:hypothetical protein
MNERVVARGRVCFRGAGQPSAQVLAVDERLGAAIAEANSDADGRFELAVPAGEGQLLVFARCRGPVAGLALSRIEHRDEDDIRLAIDNHGGAWPLTIELQSDAPTPPSEPSVQIVPLAIRGIAAEDMRWTLARVGEVAGSALETLSMSGGAIVRTVQEGRWWLRADVLLAYEVRTPDAEPVSSWVSADAQLEDGTPLARSHGGFEVDVAQPTTVRVRLAPQPPAAPG